MSVVRWGESSDVYVYYSVKGCITCCACSLQEPGPSGWPPDFECQTEDEMMEHLYQHASHGDMVPQHAFERLEDAKANPS